MNCDEAEELITGLVDGQLRAAEHAALDNHFKGCTKCRFRYAQEQNLKKALHAAGAELRASPALKERLANDPRIVANGAPAVRRWLHRLAGEHPLLRGALAAAVFLLLVIPPVLRSQRDNPPISLLAVQSYNNFFGNDGLSVRTQDLGALTQALTAMVDGRFQPMAYDFSMMQTKLVGGAVRELNGRPVLVTRYQGTGHWILCFTFIGTEADAPRTAAAFHDSDKRLDFHAFTVGNVNAVMHREDQVICILASDMTMTDLLNLARSKANPHKHL